MLGIIGGSGLYEALTIIREDVERELKTPYGTVTVVEGKIAGRDVVFLPRHGKDCLYPPHKIPYEANIKALSVARVTRVIATSAVGVIAPQIAVGELVLIDQFIDLTGRVSTFYDGGDTGVMHVDLTHPFCSELHELLWHAARELDITIHHSGTYACFAGPGFETLAEVNMAKCLGADLVGMTLAAEAKLAREAELCYQPITLPVNRAGTGERITHENTLKVMAQMQDKLAELIEHTLLHIPAKRSCECASALG